MAQCRERLHEAELEASTSRQDAESLTSVVASLKRQLSETDGREARAATREREAAERVEAANADCAAAQQQAMHARR